MSNTNFDPQLYRKASEHQQQWGQAVLAQLPLRGDESALDLGCGDGRLTAELARLLPRGHVLGIDSSAEMVQATRDLGVTNVSAEVGNIDDLDYEQAFDFVFSNATLQWIKDHGRMLAAIHRSLRPGGFVRLQFAGRGNCATLVAVLKDIAGRGDYAPLLSTMEWPWYLPSAEAYEPLVRQAGFNRVQVWTANADRYFGSAQQMVDWIDQPCLVPFMRHLPQRQRQPFRDAVVAEMLSLTRREDGRHFEKFERLNVLAWR